MKVVVTRNQFIEAHLIYVNHTNKTEFKYYAEEERKMFSRINDLFLFDIKHVELEYEDFALICKYWPKKKN